MVFVKKSLREAVKRIETVERGIGLLGFGVSSRTSMTWISADLEYKGNKAVNSLFPANGVELITCRVSRSASWCMIRRFVLSMLVSEPPCD